MLGRWLRERRVRRLRDRACTRDAEDLAGAVHPLREAATSRGRAQTLAVEALSAIARGDGSDAPTAVTLPGSGPSTDDVDANETAPSVPERAAVTLVDVLPAIDDDGLAADVVRTLRYVVTERPDTVIGDRLDGPVAAAVDDWSHAAHRQVALDAGRLVRTSVPTGQVQSSLWTALDGGPPSVRENAALAYLQVADRPDRLDDPGRVAAGLRTVVGGRDDSLPRAGTAARTLADGRTVAEAAALFERAARRSSSSPRPRLDRE